jgi:hypothetical protein
VKCAKFSSNVATLYVHNRKYKCANYGFLVACDQGFVLTSVCTSGGNSDCALPPGGCPGARFTVLQCTLLQFKPEPTPGPIAAPTTPAPVAPTISPAQASCLDDTLTILDAVDNEYNDTGVIPKHTNVNGTETQFVDYSTNQGNNAVYQSACTDDDVGGVYKEITYKMECSTTNAATGATSTIDAYVVGHPRCYAAVCEEADEQALLVKYSLHLTEERALKEDKGVWNCAGELTDDVPAGSCQLETEAINKLPEVIIARVGLREPTIEQKTFLFMFPKAEDVVTFQDVPSFSSACTEKGYMSQAVASADVECVSESGSEETRGFDVKNFQVCLGSLCESTSSTAEDVNGAIVSQFYDLMVANAALDATFKCTMREWNATAEASFLDKYGLYLGIAVGALVVGGIIIAAVTGR